MMDDLLRDCEQNETFSVPFQTFEGLSKALIRTSGLRVSSHKFCSGLHSAFEDMDGPLSCCPYVHFEYPRPQ